MCLGVRRALEVLSVEKVDAAPMLKRTGLAGIDVVTRDRFIPAEAEARLIELAAQASGEAAFGVRLAEGANPRDAGLIYYLFSAASTLRRALTLLARYVAIANAALAMRLSLPPDADAALEVEYVGLRRQRIKHTAEYHLALVIQTMRDVTNRPISPSRVTFVHQRSFGVREVERYFACPVHFGAAADRIMFARQTLDTALPNADERLLAILEPYAADIAALRGRLTASLRVAVENEMQKQLPNGPIRIDIVAAALGASSRSLSRRLSEEGATFSDILDDLRRTLALQYLADPALTVDRTAALIGYGDVGAFTHAFRRWTGYSPSQMRTDPALLAQFIDQKEL